MAIIKWALGYISVTLFCLNDEIRLFILYNTHITPYIKSSKDFANFLKISGYTSVTQVHFADNIFHKS